ncbi:MAG: hypothetical protein ACQEQO_00480 [Thermodesulfobacteriota bacterium]
MTQEMDNKEAEVCQNCGNIYRVSHLKVGDDWNDFGYRHCPFYGMLTDEYAHLRHE